MFHCQHCQLHQCLYKEIDCQCHYHVIKKKKRVICNLCRRCPALPSVATCTECFVFRSLQSRSLRTGTGFIGDHHCHSHHHCHRHRPCHHDSRRCHCHHQYFAWSRNWLYRWPEPFLCFQLWVTFSHPSSYGTKKHQHHPLLLQEPFFMSSHFELYLISECSALKVSTSSPSSPTSSSSSQSLSL